VKHVARKRFGQNFLIDQGVIGAIISAIDPQPGDVLVEIGPGLGALTEPLLAAMPRTQADSHPLHVVELDRDLAARLSKRHSPERLAVHQADALQFDFSGLVPESGRLRIVGNLPYNISSPLLFRLMEMADRVTDQHFMLQKEVVERMVANAGDSAFGRLSVMLQVRYQMHMLFEVPPESFDPPPRVDSAIVRMLPRPASLVPMAQTDAFAKLVMQAFSQRRKMLRNTLREYAAQLEQVGIEPTARAEEVSVENYVALVAAIAAH